MRILQVTLSIALFFGFIHAMNTKFGALPPIGKFTNPFSGFWQNAEKIDLNPKQKIILKDLDRKVEVIFDEYYIPHIFAENDRICSMHKVIS